MTKPGSTERGDKWKAIADIFNMIELPKFATNQRSAKELFQYLFEKRKAKNREEERASGISTDVTEIDVLLDELIELFETANLEHKTAAKEKSDKANLDVEKGREMRRMSLESMGESSKRKSNESGKGNEKRSKRTGGETYNYLKEKLKIDVEWRRKEREMKEWELERKKKEERVRRKREEGVKMIKRGVFRGSWKACKFSCSNKINC